MHDLQMSRFSVQTLQMKNTNEQHLGRTDFGMFPLTAPALPAVCGGGSHRDPET